MTNVLQHIANYTGGEFYIAKTAEDIVDIYNIIGLNQHIDMTDTDGDGIADTFETAGMRLSNGEIIYTDPLNWDTDGDGIRDGDEIVMGGFGSIHAVRNEDGSYTFTSDYGITFYMKSNPAMSDSDGDGYNDKVDPRPLKCDVFKYALKNEEYIAVHKNNYMAVKNSDKSFGGNQNWFDNDILKNYGCGLIAISDVLLYLAMQNSQYSTYYTSIVIQSNGMIDYSSYLNYVEYNIRFFSVYRWFGLNGLYMANGVNNYSSYCNGNLNAKWGVATDEILEKTLEMLNNDIPVVLSFGPSDKLINLYELFETYYQKTGATNNHYVVVTGAKLDNVSETVWLEISSWGKKYYINYSEYMDYIKSANWGNLKYDFSNILYISK